MRHYYDFGADRDAVGDDLASQEAWDALRTATSGAFAMSRSRREFHESATQRRDLATRAHEIDAWLGDNRAQSVASYGVGAAHLELLLRICRPDRNLVITDYAPATTARLAKLFPEARVVTHDLRRDGPVEADAHLLLSDHEWPDVFDRFSSATILVVATALLTVQRAAMEIVRRPRLRLRRASAAGYIRTAARFEELWHNTHSSRRFRVHDLHAWSLEPREREDR
jgi:hypothetical protein